MVQKKKKKRKNGKTEIFLSLSLSRSLSFSLLYFCCTSLIVQSPSAATSGFRITTPTTGAPGPSVRGPGAASISRDPSTALHEEGAPFARAPLEASGSPRTTTRLTETPDLQPAEAPFQLAALAGDERGPAAALLVSSPLRASKQIFLEAKAPRANAIT